MSVPDELKKPTLSGQCRPPVDRDSNDRLQNRNAGLITKISTVVFQTNATTTGKAPTPMTWKDILKNQSSRNSSQTTQLKKEKKTRENKKQKNNIIKCNIYKFNQSHTT